MDENVGDRFQQGTKYARQRTASRGQGFGPRPSLYKIYPGQPRIPLPQPAGLGEISLDRALHLRRSIRRFTDAPLTLDQLASLLWAATGIQREEYGHQFRTAPSAGALYPIETYLVANDVSGLPEGLYHYAIQDHALEELRQGSLGQAIADAALGQAMCADAPIVLVWTAILQRCRFRYGQRAFRYIYLDVGHIAENLALAATALGLGSCQIGAFLDDEASALVGVDGKEETAIYLSVVGQPA